MTSDPTISPGSPEGSVVLVTGASRGLGLEFVRQYADAGWHVIATCRDPQAAEELRTLEQAHPGPEGPKVVVEQLDVTDADSVAALAARYRDQAIDVLINNAGTMGALPYEDNLDRQHFGQIDYDLWVEVLDANLFGAMRVTEAFVDNVAASERGRIVNISSTTGSIGDSFPAAAFAYTTSKAALNKAMSVVAHQLEPRGVIVAMLCPGYVKTRMGFRGAQIEIPDSIAGMRKLIDGMTLADSGTFRRYNGETIGW